MSNRTTTYLIFILTALVVFGSVFLIYHSILVNNQANFVYPLDDAYIHLTLARNWVQTGVPSINPGEFVFVSSSPLWTSIIALANLIGINSQLLPFYLNLFLLLILLFYLQKVISEKIKNSYLSVLIILLTVFATSAILLVFTGLEHLLQSVLFLILLLNVNKFVDAKSEKDLAGLYFLLVLFALTRYESLFFIALLASVLMFKKSYRRAMLVVLAGIIPLSVVGIYSIMHGGTFLPASVLLKGEFANSNSFFDILKSLFYHPFKKLYHSVPLAIILFFDLFLLFRYRKAGILSWENIPLVIYAGVVVLHLLFAQTGWFYRYEAYLILGGIVLIVVRFQDLVKQNQILLNKTIIITLSILALFFVGRAYETNASISTASKNIYEQQWQMAEFLNRYYAGDTVAVNDIGLIGYRANVHLCDLWGLANKSIFEQKLKGKLDGEFYDKILSAENVYIAVVYKHWFSFRNGFCSDWLDAGSWTIRDNIICGGEKVSFFAKDRKHFKLLVKNLIDYSGYLPRDVIQKINTEK